MNELSKEYIFLFNALTDIREAMAQLEQSLILAQQRAEELYLEGAGGTK